MRRPRPTSSSPTSPWGDNTSSSPRHHESTTPHLSLSTSPWGDDASPSPCFHEATTPLPLHAAMSRWCLFLMATTPFSSPNRHEATTPLLSLMSPLGDLVLLRSSHPHSSFVALFFEFRSSWLLFRLDWSFHWILTINITKTCFLVIFAGNPDPQGKSKILIFLH